VNQLEEQDARSGERGTGEQKAGAKDQRDAVLGTLEPHKGDSSKDEREEPSSNLQITLKDGIRTERNLAQPERCDKHEQEAAHVQQKALKESMINYEGKLAHSVPAFGRI
jgi:hypothetical protein